MRTTRSKVKKEEDYDEDIDEDSDEEAQDEETSSSDEEVIQRSTGSRSRKSSAAPQQQPPVAQIRTTIPPVLHGRDDPLITKDRIKDLLRRLDHEQRLDADVETLTVELVQDFVENVTKSAILLCKHRQGNVLEAQDAQLITEKNYNIKVPGFGMDQSSFEFLNARKRKATTTTRIDAHLAKLAIVRESARKAGIVKRNARAKARK